MRDGLVGEAQPNAPFAELVRLSKTSIADETDEIEGSASLRTYLSAKLESVPVGAVPHLFGAKTVQACLASIRQRAQFPVEHRQPTWRFRFSPNCETLN
jgi:hypothetical protein